MSAHRLSGCVFGRPHTVARQYALVQALEFFNDERVDTGLLMLRHMARHGSLDTGERLVFRMDDGLADGLFDHVAAGQAQGGAARLFSKSPAVDTVDWRGFGKDGVVLAQLSEPRQLYVANMARFAPGWIDALFGPSNDALFYGNIRQPALVADAPGHRSPP